MKIYTRAELGSRPFRTPPSYASLSQRREVTIHYPGAGIPPRELAAYRRWIETIHMDQNGWRGVGYNYFVDADGRVGEGCGRDVIGAHCPPHNVDGFGVNVWTANGVPTEAGKRAARELYDYLCQVTDRTLRMGYHGKDYATECPGSALRNWVKGGMKIAGAPKPPSKPTPQGTGAGGAGAGGGGAGLPSNASGGTYPKPNDRVVYDSKIRPGQKDSDSIWWVQAALNAVSLKGGREIPLTGDYDALTVAEVKKFQSQKCKDPADGDLGPKQTRYLFDLAKINVTHKEKP